MPEAAAIAYLAAKDVKSFLMADTPQQLGYSYEWEDENVIHIHLHPLKHAFGVPKRCLFKMDSDCHRDDFSKETPYVAIVSSSAPDTIKVYTSKDNNILEIKCAMIPDKEELYSRSKGLIEVDILEHKHVAIVGLGSFGSQIAIELAKAGVGEFSLFDFDRIELHNLGRHSCYLKDLGRLKTDAIEEAILGKNPFAKINKYPINIVSSRDVFENIISTIDLLICATDNNESRFIISSALYRHQKVGIFGRAITRAAGGDVFRYTPGGPCYSCLLGTHIINTRDEEISSVEAGRRSGAIPAYASADDVNTMVQVGLSVDIEPICNLMLKLALLELSKGLNSGISSLNDDLIYDAYIWANRRDHNFANWHPFYKSGAKQTILKWYGITIPKDEHCAICSENLQLDTGISGNRNAYKQFDNVDFGLYV